jgi:hypothetical protein
VSRLRLAAEKGFRAAGNFRSLDAAVEKNKNCSEEGEAYLGFALLFAALFSSRKVDFRDGKKGEATTTLPLVTNDQ